MQMWVGGARGLVECVLILHLIRGRRQMLQLTLALESVSHTRSPSVCPGIYELGGILWRVFPSFA